MMSGLLIREPYIDWILNGPKIWEIRGSRTTKRGRIGLIQSGTGQVGVSRIWSMFKNLATSNKKAEKARLEEIAGGQERQEQIRALCEHS
jgi:hypothetical protein